MKIEDQVCSLELAKKLKEMNIKQESLVYWLNVQHCVHMKVKEDGHTIQTDSNGNSIIDRIDYRIEIGNPFAWNIDKNNYWSAFTVAELGKMLPDNCYTQKDCGTIPIEWICHRIIDESQEDVWIAETEADARAKMLIYLLENKLMELSND